MDLALYEAPDGVLLVRQAPGADEAADRPGLRPLGRAAVVTGDLSVELVAALRRYGCGAAQPDDVRSLLLARAQRGSAEAGSRTPSRPGPR